MNTIVLHYVKTICNNHVKHDALIGYIKRHGHVASNENLTIKRKRVC